MTFFIIWKNNKTCFALGRLVLAFGLCSGFFGLQKAFGLLQAKKSLKQPSGQNNLAAAKKGVFFFLMTHMSVHFS